MKTNQITLTLFICFLLLFNLKVQSQIDWETKNKRTSVFRTQLKEAFYSMTKNATLAKRVDGKPCTSENLIAKFNDDIKPVYIGSWALSPFISGAGLFLQDYTIEEFDKGLFKTLEDKALHAYNTTSNFGEFVYALTGKEIGQIKKEKTNDNNETFKDIDYLNSTYRNIKKFFTDDIPINHQKQAADGCIVYSIYSMKVKKYSYPNIEYTLKVEVDVKCDCELESKTEESVKSGYFEYEATTTGLFTHSAFTFSKAKNPIVNVISLNCCPSKEKEEPTETALADDGIENLMPDQTFGGGAGFGATQDFEEISYCVFAEYLKKINYTGDNGWYVGAEASYANTSFGDFGSNRFNVGGKLQYHVPITPSKETQFVAGIMGSYNFGTNDNGFSKDDVTGIIGCAYGGVNIRVCENWSLFGQFPVLIYETFTFKSDSGGEFKTDGTSVLLNKNNPLKLGVRYSF